MVAPETMSFENLKTFSVGKLWNDQNEPEYLWVDKVQHQRNAIHFFKWREIGTTVEFLDDISVFCDFVENILNHFPPIEDYIETYPAGYIMNPHGYLQRKNDTWF